MAKRKNHLENALILNLKILSQLQVQWNFFDVLSFIGWLVVPLDTGLILSDEIGFFSNQIVTNFYLI